jgi:hypothetical protein
VVSVRATVSSPPALPTPVPKVFVCFVRRGPGRQASDVPLCIHHGRVEHHERRLLAVLEDQQPPQGCVHVLGLERHEELHRGQVLALRGQGQKRRYHDLTSGGHEEAGGASSSPPPNAAQPTWGVCLAAAASASSAATLRIGSLRSAMVKEREAREAAASAAEEGPGPAAQPASEGRCMRLPAELGGRLPRELGGLTVPGVGCCW